MPETAARILHPILWLTGNNCINKWSNSCASGCVRWLLRLWVICRCDRKCSLAGIVALAYVEVVIVIVFLGPAGIVTLVYVKVVIVIMFLGLVGMRWHRI